MQKLCEKRKTVIKFCIEPLACAHTPVAKVCKQQQCVKDSKNDGGYLWLLIPRLSSFKLWMQDVTEKSACHKAFKPFLTCILHFHPGPSLFVVWQTRKKTATQSNSPSTLHLIEARHVCLGRKLFRDANESTCCAVSILSFSMVSIWKPLCRMSSVDAGTVAAKGDCNDRDERLHRSSMGNCTGDKDCLFHTHKPQRQANWVAGASFTACLDSSHFSNNPT